MPRDPRIAGDRRVGRAGARDHRIPAGDRSRGQGAAGPGRRRPGGTAGLHRRDQRLQEHGRRTGRRQAGARSGIDLEDLDRVVARERAGGPHGPMPLPGSELPESHGTAALARETEAAARLGGAGRRAHRRRRSVRRALLRRRGERGGYAADQGRRRRGAGDLPEQLLEDTGAGVPRRVDGGARSARVEARSVQADAGPDDAGARSAHRLRGVSTGHPDGPAADAAPVLPGEAHGDADGTPGAAGRPHHVAGAEGRILPVGDAAGAGAAPTRCCRARSSSASST